MEGKGRERHRQQEGKKGDVQRARERGEEKAFRQA